MKKVPLKVLKENLSEITESVANGQAIEVTKYHRPYLQMLPCQSPSVHCGKDHGRISLTPCLSQSKTKGSYLKYLKIDREDRFS